MRYVVTGGAGFIGSNIVHALNKRGENDIIVVDNLERPGKFTNLVGLQISDYFEKGDFLTRFRNGEVGAIDVIFHEGACSDTMEHDGHYVIENNYRWSKDLLDICLDRGTRLLYASSAAVYGASQDFSIDRANEKPLNVYGYSKLLFDDIVRSKALSDGKPQVAGFRYFNVYGPRESHKGRMASVAWHHTQQLAQDGYVKLFGAYDGFASGQQSRDFVYVDDLVRVKLWFLDNPQTSGIYNLGTGCAEPFNAVAHAGVNAARIHAGDKPLPLDQQIAEGLVRYVDFPEALKGKYQSFTQADISTLRAAGYEADFHSVAQGIEAYAKFLFRSG